MNKDRPRQARLAIWLLRHLGEKNNQEAIVGDLVEKFGQGRSARWLWREVLIAIGIGISKALLARWPEVCFALTGTALIDLFFSPLKIVRKPLIERMWAWGIGLRWPLSTIYDFGFTAFMGALMVLLLLIFFLFVKRALRWANILRTLLISFMLLATGQLALFLWERRLPHALMYILGPLPLFFALLASAWASSPRLHLTTSQLKREAD